MREVKKLKLLNFGLRKYRIKSNFMNTFNLVSDTQQSTLLKRESIYEK